MAVIRKKEDVYPLPWKRTTLFPSKDEVGADPGYGKVRIPGARSLGDWLRSILPREYSGTERRERPPPGPTGLTYNGLGTEYAFAPVAFSRAYPVYA